MRLWRIRLAAVGMAALLLLYLLFAIGYAIVLLGVGEPVTTAMGIALLVLPIIGLWALVAELMFGVRADRLAARLESEGGEPTEELPTRGSGRVDRTAADEIFPQYKAAAEAAPQDWRAWFRLALAYDASGDRRRARWATRRAIRLAAGES